jgi:hypothetical protein
MKSTKQYVHMYCSFGFALGMYLIYKVLCIISKKQDYFTPQFHQMFILLILFFNPSAALRYISSIIRSAQ